MNANDQYRQDADDILDFEFDEDPEVGYTFEPVVSLAEISAIAVRDGERISRFLRANPAIAKATAPDTRKKSKGE